VKFSKVMQALAKHGVLEKRTVYRFPLLGGTFKEGEQEDPTGEGQELSLFTGNNKRERTVVSYKKLLTKSQLAFHSILGLDSQLPSPKKTFETVEEVKATRGLRADVQREAIERIKEAMKVIWFPSEMRELSKLLAAENKGHEVSWNRVYNVLFEPVLRYQMQEKVSKEAMHQGVMAALRANAPNGNYVTKVARTWDEKNKSAIAYSYNDEELDSKDVPRTVDGVEITVYDKWALDDERYRDAYIAYYG
jgi:hypothetical protein